MKIGRNEKCPCGSMEKYKKCCLNKMKVYIFNARPLWTDTYNCRLRLSEGETLCDIHDYLQNALEWDNDHMYSFFLDNKFWNRKTEYSANPMGEGSADICLGNLNLIEKQKIAYVFDYGDENRFELFLEKIELRDHLGDLKVGVINEKGKAPEQYANDIFLR